MGKDGRIRDAEQALGNKANEYAIEYEQTKDGKSQLILFGESLERKTIEKLKQTGFEFLYAKSTLADDEEDEDDKEDEDEDEKDGVESTDKDTDEVNDDIRIVFEDLKASSK